MALLTLVLPGQPALARDAASALPPGTPHWSEVVWYEVFVRSFQDSDGDGIGDLRGLIERLPYLSGLGVGGLWLMPIYPSPSYHGYDVTDYTGVNPEYGDEADLVELVERAHELGIRVILDFVPNHTSSAHPWFRAALAGDETFRAYYRFERDPPPMRGTRGGNAWHLAPDGTSYLGLFSERMPDLNLANPAVTAELQAAALHWLELGVDGFRIDAIQHLIEGPDGQISNTPETYEWVRAFEAYVHEVAPHAFLVGETWTEMPAIVRYHTAGNLDMSFDYPLWKVLLSALQSRSAADLADTLAQERKLYPEGAVRGTFLDNHDQTRLATRLSIPRRDEARLKLAAGLLLTLPGTPFVYYGDEIGMPDGPGVFDVEKRTPMRWEAVDADGLFGFSTAQPWTDPGRGIPGVSVAEQDADPASLLNHYRHLAALRNSHEALRSGDWSVVPTGSSRAVLALVRTAPGGERLLVLANLSARAAEWEPGDLRMASYPDLVTGAPLRVLEGGNLELPALGLSVIPLR
jgi:glycosidase